MRKGFLLFMVILAIGGVSGLVIVEKDAIGHVLFYSMMAVIGCCRTLAMMIAEETKE